jgi:hypothetical protein
MLFSQALHSPCCIVSSQASICFLAIPQCLLPCARHDTYLHAIVILLIILSYCFPAALYCFCIPPHLFLYRRDTYH